jgi:hypothetical protein
MSDYDQWISNMITYKRNTNLIRDNKANVVLYNTELDPDDEMLYNYISEKVQNIVIPRNEKTEVQECLVYANLKRKEIDKKRAMQRVREYDNKNSQSNRRWTDYLESEEQAPRAADILDSKMNNILVRNLVVNTDELNMLGVSEELDEAGQNTLKRQNETALLRQREFDEVKSKAVKSIQDYDDKKKKNDRKYNGIDFTRIEPPIKEHLSALQDKIDMVALRNSRMGFGGGFQAFPNLDFY